MARIALTGALVCLLGACGDGGSATTGEGSLTLRISTTGTDFDPDGYSISLDAGTLQPVAVNDTLEFQNLAAGEHMIELGDVRSNCVPVSPNPSAVSIEAGGATDAAMEIECFQRTGVIQIRTFTYGEGGNPDGYLVRVGTLTRAIELTGSVAVAVGPGTYEVLLDGLTDQCGVDGANPEVVTVAPDTVERVTFEVRCAQGRTERATVSLASQRAAVRSPCIRRTMAGRFCSTTMRAAGLRRTMTKVFPSGETS